MEPDTPIGIAGVSPRIDLVKINGVNYTQVQEDRSVRRHEVISTTNDIEDATIADKFVGTNMDQDGIL